MDNITVIIPVHVYDEQIGMFLDVAVDSVFRQSNTAENIMIVGPQEVILATKTLLETKKENWGKLTFLVNDGETDYCNQINLAVMNCKTKFFSILGFDDEYSKTWFKNVDIYTKNMPEFSIFMPIINFIDKDNSVVGTVNEIIWAMSFSNGNNIGVIDEDTLQAYYDFSVSGAIFRTDDFIEIGMLKPSIKLAFWYEFLLRASTQGLKIFVIPKNGYYQRIDRENSILDQLGKNMDAKERAWWLKLASKEYYFKQERKKSYKYTPEKELTEIEGLV